MGRLYDLCTCKLGRHPKRFEVEEEIINERPSIRIADQVEGLSPSEIQNHATSCMGITLPQLVLDQGKAPRKEFNPSRLRRICHLSKKVHDLYSKAVRVPLTFEESQEIQQTQKRLKALYQKQSAEGCNSLYCCATSAVLNKIRRSKLMGRTI